MKYFINILFLLSLLIAVAYFAKPVLADDTNSQTNTSGSNTNITGGYTTTNNNTYQSGSSNDTTSTTTNNTTNTTNNKSTIPVNSANAPSYSSMSQDVCSMAVSGAISSSLVGVSGGKHFADLNCERIKLAKVLKDFGMSVASVSILCQDSRVFAAMESAGTPCPFQGKIGEEAAAKWKKYPELRPDYEEYIKREEYMSSIRIETMCEDCDANVFDRNIHNE
tara:strand:+ start:1429 stop:2094 length:666 start_codon:yes stop_codon:yes gene_type:complete